MSKVMDMVRSEAMRIAKAKGEIISFLDDDDFYFPDRLTLSLQKGGGVHGIS